MGEYTTRVRYGDRTYVRLSSQESNTNKYYFRNAQYVYSWRSRRTKYDLSDQNAGTSLGVRTPSSKGSVFDIIADRKRYIEDLNTTMGGLDNSNLASAKVFSKTDTGHRFISMKYDSVEEARWTQYNKGVAIPFRDNPIQAFECVYVPVGHGLPASVFPTRESPAPLGGPSKLERQARLNQAFHSLNPVAPQAQIGEAIVSLIRGDFPTIMKNINKFLMTRSAKGAGKYAGGEYLNSVFGWAPLIRDFENAIKVLLAIDNLIYGKSSRRHRTLVWDRETTVRKDPPLWFTTPYGTRGGSGGGSIGSYYGAELTLTSKFDIRLSARVGSIARPTIGANDFVSQAYDKLHDLGLWYPSLGWDLLPFSWLVDWFTNLGSSLNNALYYSGSNKMVNIDYAWATSCLRTYGQVEFGKRRITSPTGTVTVTGTPRALSVFKVREGATPFGFGLDLSGLKPGQIAILVALGLVKIP